MKAAIFGSSRSNSVRPLQLEDVPEPPFIAGHLKLRVRACGACRTDLHIIKGELPARRQRLIPGHQIVGEIVDGATDEFPLGMRVGVGWMGGVDETCPYCEAGAENLCDTPVYTGYTVDGGYAEYAMVRSDFAFPLPDSLDDVHAAPLLCAGIVGYRSLRVAGVEPGDRVGLFGSGSSAHLAISVLRALHCEVYVSTGSAAHRELAATLGATWVGSQHALPPVALDRAITFGPGGDLVTGALGSLRKGGVVAINALRPDRMPEFDHHELLWNERQIRSVTNYTRKNAIDFLQIAADIGLKPKVTVFPLDKVNEALAAIQDEEVAGSVVVVP